MASPIRHFDPQTIYFITSRTIESMFLLAPSAKTNELIGGILARAVRRCGVELYGYVFTSNHFHLMVRSRAPVLMSKFMQQLQSDIAIKVGRLVDKRGKFFGRRYSAEPIVDHKAQVDRLKYILSHGVKEGLVATVKAWPGLSCAQALLEGGRSTQHRWRNWTRRWKMELQEDIKVDRFADDCPSEEETLTLTPLPRWARLSAKEQSRRVAKLVYKINRKAKAPSTTAAAIAARDPHYRPPWSKHSQRPKAHASTVQLWIKAVREYRAVVAAFKAASREWFAGKFEVEFPLHCFRPPAWVVTQRGMEVS